MKKFIYLFAVASLFLLGSCGKIDNYNEDVEENAPAKHTERWASDYHNQKFDTLLMVRADSLELMDNETIVLYDKDLNKKYVVSSQDVGHSMGRVFIWTFFIMLFFFLIILMNLDC